MKRKILSVFLAVTLTASLFTGCGKKKEEEGNYSEVDVKSMDFKTNQQIDTTSDITLTVWESAQGPDEFIKKAGDYFTELYPNIKINYVNIEATDSSTKITLDGPAGNGPDLFASAHNNAGVMAAAGSIAKIPDEEKEYVKSNCTEQALAGATLNAADGSSTLYGFPVSVETYALFYNKDLISEDEIPTTMADLLTYMESFSSSHDSGQYPFLFDSGNAYYSVMFTSTPSNHLYGETGNDIKNTYMNTAEAVAQMDDFVKLSKAINLQSGDIPYKDNDAKFGEGNLAMDISGAWNINTFKEDGVNFGITSIPALTGSDVPPTNFMGVRCMFVSNYSKHIPEAIAFGEFLMTKEMQKLRCEMTSTMPSRDDVLDTISDPDIKTYMQGLQKQIAYSYPMPNMAQASLFWTAFASAYQNIWNGKSTDIQAELDKANKTATKK